MINILCYGDSNTWGYNPIKNGERHNYKDRWTTILGNKLGDNYLVIPEGLNGRTTVWDDPLKKSVNGKKLLQPILDSHKPLDLVILMLGTNDLKQRLNLPASDIALGISVLIEIILKSESGLLNKPPKILILIPPEVRKLSNFLSQFGDCTEKSKSLSKEFILICNKYHIDFIDVGKKVRFSDSDGIHFEKDQLPILADMVYNKILEIL